MADQGRRTLFGVVVVLLAFMLLLAGTTAYYYYLFDQASSQNQAYIQQLRQLNVKYSSSILFDFGNGTRQWYNDTRLEPGWNLYVATQVIADGRMNATYYPQYSAHLVTSIYNIADTKSEYWLIWTYNKTTSWQMAQVGADQLSIHNGSVYAWTYCGSSCVAP